MARSKNEFYREIGGTDMFIRKKMLLTMINILNGEVAYLKKKVSELESFNTSKKVNLNIDGNKVGVSATKICLASTEPIVSFDSKGLTVNGKVCIKGNKEGLKC